MSLTILTSFLLLINACGSTASEDGTKGAQTAGRATTNAPLEVEIGDGGATTADEAQNLTTTTGLDGSTVSVEDEPPTSVEVADPGDQPLPDSSAAMVESLNAAEAAIRDTTLTVESRSAWGRRQQALYRVLSANEAWVTDVVSSVDDEVRAAVELNWAARQNLSSLLNTEELHSELPAWRVNAPPPAEELISYYKQAEEEWGIEWEFLAGINLIETRMGRIQGVSTAGAIGPMQFLPTTWAECCDGDPTVPKDAISGAAKYLTIRGGPENMERAIWGYNNSDYYVNAVTAYANVLMADEQAYYGYHAWEIYFLSTEGLIRIPVGYEQLEPIAATEWLEQNPDSLFAG